MGTRRTFAAILAVGILCRLAFVFLTPVFYAPDEHSHFNYIKYLSEHGAFPVQTTKMGDAANEWEYFQPPLYYMALVPIYRAAQALFHNEAATVFTLRLVSILLWLVTVRFGALWLRQLPIKDDLVKLSALALLCLLPTYSFISAVINNDNLLAAIGGALICLLTRREQNVRTSLALGVLLGLALLVKQSALVLALGIALAPVIDWLRRQTTWTLMLRRAGLPLAIATLIYFPWALRNWRVYGTLTPEGLSAVPMAWPSMIYGMASAAHNLIKSFWAVSGIANNVGYPLAGVGMIFMVAALVGVLRSWKQDPLVAANSSERFSIFAALALAIAANVVLVLRFGYQTGMGQGRHLFGLLIPIALALGFASRSLPLQNSFPRVAGFWICYTVAFVIFSVYRFP